MSHSHERSITVFDVGGTHMRRAAWSPERGLGKVERRPSPSFSRLPDTPAGELQAMLVREMTGPMPPGGTAGVSFGAALDHRTGTVYASAPLWGAHAEPYDLGAVLRAARPDVRWHVVNDVTAALLHLEEAHTTPLPMTELAERAGLSLSSFERQVRRVYGVTPSQLLTRARLGTASRLLRQTDWPVARVAVECGYFDHSAFTRAFRSAVGLTPAQFRRLAWTV